MLMVYGKYYGVTEELAMKLAAGFGGGMGGMGKTCGAVSGAIAVLGLTYEIGNPAAKASVYSLVKEFAKRFTNRHSTVICNELLGHDISTPEGIQTVREKKLFSTVCPMVDRSAAEILEELLAEGFPFHGNYSDKN
jgi:C_GCAxxG_C_C family probable redox protein